MFCIPCAHVASLVRSARRMVLVSIIAVIFQFAWVQAENENSAYPMEAWPTDLGYLVVNETSNARMFYAYYEAISPSDELCKTPLILWLQGGPGCSSMIGNFYELGPWKVGDDMQLHKNEAPWNHLYGVLFLDNPVGTGFSIATYATDIPTNEDEVARDVYTALQKFFDKHEVFRERPFYVTGESYAGKYVPAVSNYILAKNGSGGHRMRKMMAMKDAKSLRLDGIAIGNGLTHPIAQVLEYAPVAYSMGLIDETQRDFLQSLAYTAVSLMEKESWTEALDVRMDIVEHLENMTGLATLYDVRRDVAYYKLANGTNILSVFLNQDVVKSVLKTETKRKWFSCSSIIANKLAQDIPQSTKYLVEALLPHVPVLLYQGEFDIRDGVASSEAWIERLNWSENDSFKASERKVWIVNGTVAGYVRSYDKLTHVIVRNAGHFVPADQTYHSQLMIEGWISGKGIA